MRRELNQSLAPAAVAAGIALLIAVVTSMLLAQLVLRPMHVIRSSLSRLGRGDLGATLDLRDDEEFRELGDVFDQVSAQLRAASPEGIKPAQLAELSRRIVDGRPADRRRRPRDEEPAQRDDHSSRAAEAEAGGGRSRRRTHVEIIGHEIRRLDERIQGFLKFVRPEEVTFGPVAIAPLLSSVLDAVQPGSAARRRVDHARLHRRRPAGGRRRRAAARRVPQPRAERDPGDAEGRPADHHVRRRCQTGASACASKIQGSASRPRTWRRFSSCITRPRRAAPASGLSMVYRTIQIHNGEIDVESTVGVGHDVYRRPARAGARRDSYE